MEIGHYILPITYALSLISKGPNQFDGTSIQFCLSLLPIKNQLITNEKIPHRIVNYRLLVCHIWTTKRF